jgi:hypothetical protein
MTGPDVRVECRPIVIDLIEHNPVCFALRDQDVKALAPWFFAAGRAGIVVDQTKKGGIGARLEAKVDDDYELIHSTPPFTRQ